MEYREVSKLKVNPLNPRGDVLIDDSLRELAASIRSRGVLCPILITPDGTIVAGHRRVKACELASVNEIPVVIRELDETTQIQVMLIENLQRSDLNPVQEGKAFQSLIQRGLSPNKIFLATGISKPKIENRLLIASFPAECHEPFASGRLSTSSAGCLGGMDGAKQIEWVKLALENGWQGSELCRHIHKSEAQVRRWAEGLVCNKTILDKIWARVEDGCYTPDAIRVCSECDRPIFELSNEEIHEYLKALVADGRAEWRKQGGKKDESRGQAMRLCVPADLPTGAIDFSARDRLSRDNEYAR